MWVPSALLIPFDSSLTVNPAQSDPDVNSSDSDEDLPELVPSSEVGAASSEPIFMPDHPELIETAWPQLSPAFMPAHEMAPGERGELGTSHSTLFPTYIYSLLSAAFPTANVNGTFGSSCLIFILMIYPVTLAMVNRAKAAAWRHIITLQHLQQKKKTEAGSQCSFQELGEECHRLAADAGRAYVVARQGMIDLGVPEDSRTLESISTLTCFDDHT